jgi:hypothetical protein
MNSCLGQRPSIQVLLGGWSDAPTGYQSSKTSDKRLWILISQTCLSSASHKLVIFFTDEIIAPKHRPSAFATFKSEKRDLLQEERDNKLIGKISFISLLSYTCLANSTPENTCFNCSQHQTDLATSGYLITMFMYQCVSEVRSRISLLQCPIL